MTPPEATSNERTTMNERQNTNATMIDRVKASYGEGYRTSDWLTVEQSFMDRFAEVTLDPDWMHIDPERARRDGPFDTTIAFGFWTISMLTHFTRQIAGSEYPEGIDYGFNYGFDRVRLMAPIPIGSRIRLHSKLLDIENRGTGRYLVRTENRVEIEGEEKPAMVAEWLGMMVAAAEEEAMGG
jgi:acyl dehydratase